MKKPAVVLTIIAYAALIASVAIWYSISSIEWGIFISWPVLFVGFVVWAILLTVAHRYDGHDKKAVSRRNLRIFLVLLALIIVVTLATTIWKR